jgi:hypothetical protein
VRQLFEYHPVIGHKFVPNLRVRVPFENGGYLVRTNCTGFRCDHEHTHQRTQGIYRILLFGDSTAAGDGVSNGKRFGDVLEQALPGTEVFNMAIPGSGTDQQYLLYREYGAPVERDLVIISVLVENVRRVAARYRIYVDDAGEERLYQKPYFLLENGELKLHGVPVRRDSIDPSQLAVEEGATVDRGGGHVLLRKMINSFGSTVKDTVQQLTRYQPFPMYENPKNPDWLLLRAILLQWVNEIEGPVLIVPMPLYSHVEGTASPDAYQARFRELPLRSGVEVFDPLPTLLRYSTEERRAFRFARDIHRTVTGHQAVGQALATRVRALRHSDGRMI